jgi:hypothetical protein
MATTINNDRIRQRWAIIVAWSFQNVVVFHLFENAESESGNRVLMMFCQMRECDLACWWHCKISDGTT